MQLNLITHENDESPFRIYLSCLKIVCFECPVLSCVSMSEACYSLQGPETTISYVSVGLPSSYSVCSEPSESCPRTIDATEAWMASR